MIMIFRKKGAFGAVTCRTGYGDFQTVAFLMTDQGYSTQERRGMSQK